MVTIKDVAKLAGVSIATVSRVVNENGYVSPVLEVRVRAAIETLGYQPNILARHLRRSESLTLGMLIPNSANPFFAEMATAVEEVCFGQGFTVALCNTNESSERAIAHFTTLFQHRVAGFIVVATAGLHSYMQQVLDGGYPIVLVDRPLPALATDAVVSDNQAGAEQALRHLIELGHRRIGLILGAFSLETIRSRWAGIVEALTQAGIPIEADLIYDEGNYLAPTGYVGAEVLLNRPNPPTAIFAFNDLMAMGVLNYAYTHGIEIPHQLSVVGFDDITMACYAVPPLTTISQPKYELGKSAAELLLRRIGGEQTAPVYRILPTQLMVRASTAPNLRAIDL